MAETLMALLEGIVEEVQRADVLTFAAFCTALLSPRALWRGRGLLALVARLVACVLVYAVVNVTVDALLPDSANFYIEAMVTGAAYCLMLRGHEWPKRVSLASIAVASWSYSACVSILSNLDPPAILLTLARAAYMLAVLAIVWLLEWHFMEPNAQMPWSFAVLILAVCLAGVLALALERSTIADFGTDDMVRSLFVSLGLQVATLVAYGMFALTVREYNDELHLREQQLSLTRRLEALQAYRLSEQSLRELRHEVKNQYAYIRTLLARGDYEGAERFFGEMELRADPTLSLAASGNRAVDDVVNLEAAKAREAGVALDARLAVPEELSLDELDLCGLLFNLLDNAIEACADLDEGTERRITLAVTAAPEQGALVIVVSNPCAHEPRVDAAGNLVTSKAEKGHGHGTRIVRQIAEKYDGVADFRCEDGVFSARVLLALA